MVKSGFRDLSEKVKRYHEKAVEYERKTALSMTYSIAMMFLLYSFLMLTLDFHERNNVRITTLRISFTLSIVVVSALYAFYLKHYNGKKCLLNIWWTTAAYYTVIIATICYQSIIVSDVSVVPLLIVILGFGLSWLHSRQYIPYLTLVMLGILILTLRDGFQYYWVVEFAAFYIFAIVLHISQVEQKCKIFEYQDVLEQERNHDKLTGLMNRRAMNDSLDQYETKKSYLAAIMVDLDHFKDVNDTFGHDAGDLALKLSSTIFKTAFPENALIARLGGDEFLIVTAICESDKEALHLSLERLLQQVPLEFKNQYHAVSVTFSAGCVVCARADIHNVGELVKKSDATMYQVKENGRNAVASTWIDGSQEVLKGSTIPVKSYCI